MLEQYKDYSQIIEPLGEICNLAGLHLKPLSMMRGSDLPEPQRNVLVSDKDLAETLGAHNGGPAHCHVLHEQECGKGLCRIMLHTLDGTSQPAAFSIVKTHLNLFSAEAAQCLRDQCPAPTAFCEQFDVSYRPLPQRYFSMAGDEAINDKFKLTGETLLYGRRLHFVDAADRSLMEIVAVLAPVQAS